MRNQCSKDGGWAQGDLTAAAGRPELSGIGHPNRAYTRVISSGRATLTRVKQTVSIRCESRESKAFGEKAEIDRGVGNAGC